MTACATASAGRAADTGTALFLLTDHVKYGVAKSTEYHGGYQNGSHYIILFREKSSVAAGRVCAAAGFVLGRPHNQPKDPSQQEKCCYLPQAKGRA